MALSENSSILKEQFGVTRLYDFDLIELHQQNYARLALNTQPDLGWFFDRGRTKFETSICALHNVDLAIKNFDRVIGLKNGKVLVDKACSDLNEDDRQKLYYVCD